VDAIVSGAGLSEGVASTALAAHSDKDATEARSNDRNTTMHLTDSHRVQD
jgi:hypothetical protein